MGNKIFQITFHRDNKQETVKTDYEGFLITLIEYNMGCQLLNDQQFFLYQLPEHSYIN